MDYPKKYLPIQRGKGVEYALMDVGYLKEKRDFVAFTKTEKENWFLQVAIGKRLMFIGIMIHYLQTVVLLGSVRVEKTMVFITWQFFIVLVILIVFSVKIGYSDRK